MKTTRVVAVRPLSIWIKLVDVLHVSRYDAAGGGGNSVKKQSNIFLGEIDADRWMGACSRKQYKKAKKNDTTTSEINGGVPEDKTCDAKARARRGSKASIQQTQRYLVVKSPGVFHIMIPSPQLDQQQQEEEQAYTR